MGNSTLYLSAVICIAAAVTWLTRALPFLIFGKRELPDMAAYLGNVLPPAIMAVLVIYCLRDVSFSESPYGIPQAGACMLVAAMQKLFGNMYLSIILGTACYMLLIRFL